VQQLARLCKPGGTVILADFMRKPGPLTEALTKRLRGMDECFQTAGSWKSSEDYTAMLGT
jgi:ubiquinone/menaquinone biosynthesis C-methylase UbiE